MARQIPWIIRLFFEKKNPQLDFFPFHLAMKIRLKNKMRPKIRKYDINFEAEQKINLLD